MRPAPAYGETVFPMSVEATFRRSRCQWVRFRGDVECRYYIWVEAAVGSWNDIG